MNPFKYSEDYFDSLLDRTLREKQEIVLQIEAQKQNRNVDSFSLDEIGDILDRDYHATLKFLERIRNDPSLLDRLNEESLHSKRKSVAVAKQKTPKENSSHNMGVNDLYPHLAWIAETQTYRGIYKRSLNLAAPSFCYFCGGNLSASPCQVMQNGFSFHQKCYDMLAERLSALKDEDEAREIFKEYPRLLSGFMLLHTYWPTYPPDWGSRARKIRARAGYICEDCDSKDQVLHVHHIMPISSGGNHADDNLICLCEFCHQGYHKNWPLGRGSRKTGVKRKSFYQIKVERILQAINEKRDIKFDYVNQKDEEKFGRCATPIRLERNEFGYQMLSARCHIDKIKKSFGVHRMTKLSVLP